MAHAHQLTRTSDPSWSRRSRFAPALVFISAFLISLVYGLWRALPSGAATLFYGLPADSRIAALLPRLGLSDSGSYLWAAVDLQDGVMSNAYIWVLNLWPPGIPYVLATLIKIGEGDSPVIGMVIVICTLWATVFATLATILVPRGGYLITAIFSVFWFVSPIFTAWTIRDGILGSDGLATAVGTLVAIGLVTATRPSLGMRARFVLFGALGVGLAALAYLRILWFYTVPLALGALLVVALLALGVALIRGHLSSLRRHRAGIGQWAVLGAIFIGLCTPWTIYVATTLHPGNPSWSMGDYQWAQLWQPTETLEAAGAGFLVAGGGNWPCELAPQRCAQINDAETATAAPYGGSEGMTFSEFRQEALLVAVTKPLDFIVDRVGVTLRSWLSVPGASVGTFGNIGFGLMTLAGFGLAVGILIVLGVRRHSTAIFLLMIFAVNVGVIWLTHFETRYLVPLQAMSLVVLAISALPLEQRLWSKFRRAGRRTASTPSE